jgi:hypothetical protein
LHEAAKNSRTTSKLLLLLLQGGCKMNSRTAVRPLALFPSIVLPPPLELFRAPDVLRQSGATPMHFAASTSLQLFSTLDELGAETSIVDNVLTGSWLRDWLLT